MSKASEAFFDAKQQVKEALDRRIHELETFVKTVERAVEGKRIGRVAHYELQSAKAQILALNEMHDFVRNTLLFDTEKYK